LVLKPGERSAATGDDQVIGSIQSAVGRTVRRRRPRKLATPAAHAQDEGAPATLGLGIDAGGTFTDCVLLDMTRGAVLAKAKAPTTHHELLLGIDEALSSLKVDDPERIRMVALSTTLATNAIVEDKGGFPGAIVMTFDGKPDNFITWQPQRVISAQMDIGGEEKAPVNRDECLAAIDGLLAEGVDAFAVSGYGSVRNPAHEVAVRELIASRCDLPVICGHELSTRLNYVNRFNTAVLNARLLPMIRDLLDGAMSILERHGIAAPLMVVKGDGSLMSGALARERPVETVLSGPAASVSGAFHLTKEREVLVMDVGGTTTDVAAIENGMVRISDEGANVGGWQTSLAAAAIQTTGLGGDSYVQFTPDRELLIGPRRVIPLCVLANNNAGAEEQLLRLGPGGPGDRGSAAALDFFCLGRAANGVAVDRNDLPLLEALQAGPLSRENLSRRLKLLSPILLRTEHLERLGYVQRCALTPTDVLHANGTFTAWNVRAAEHALSVFSELYGESPGRVGELIISEVVRRLCFEALRHEMGDAIPVHSDGKACAAVIDAALAGRDIGSVSISLKYTRPIVAIGAPVGSFFPEVGRRLNARIIIPQHADVANAIGAVASEVVAHEEAVIRPGEVAKYVFHWREGRWEFNNLEKAIDSAREVLAGLATKRAVEAGAADPRVNVDVQERRAYLAGGELELVEVRLEATARGRPAALARLGTD
jgi:N-methylhydantoinase A/oxoprolinase/acetone carboxylase beta subunit